MKHKFLKISLLLMAAAVFAAVFLAADGVNRTVYRNPGEVQGSKFIVRKGASTKDLVGEIRKTNVDLPDWVIEAGVAAARAKNSLREGWYAVKPDDTVLSLFKRLRAGETTLSRFRISDGASLREIASGLKGLEDIEHKYSGDAGSAEDLIRSYPALVNNILSIHGKGDPAAQSEKEAIPPLEGLLAPDTYFYNAGVSDVVLVGISVKRQREILDFEWGARAKGVDQVVKTPYEALVLASIIEKETGHHADRDMISSVFHNRLKAGMPLQADPTVIYGMGEAFKGKINKADLKRDTPYNTYTRTGLPPTPICSPTKLSIHAALHPADTKYLYFVAKGDGTTHFAERLSDHNKAVKKYQKKRSADYRSTVSKPSSGAKEK